MSYEFVWEAKFHSHFAMFLFTTGWHPERRRRQCLKNALIWKACLYLAELERFNIRDWPRRRLFYVVQYHKKSYICRHVTSCARCQSDLSCFHAQGPPGPPGPAGADVSEIHLNTMNKMSQIRERHRALDLIWCKCSNTISSMKSRKGMRRMMSF